MKSQDTVRRANKRAMYIFHPEGNASNNPTLMSILSSLHESGWSITVFSQRRSHQTQLPECTIVRYGRVYAKIRDLVIQRTDSLFVLRMLVRFRLSFWRIPRNAVITGVDSVGLIEAACVTTGQRKLAFLSFEILFDGEVNPKIKQRERRIGNQVRLWLSQDSDRVEALVQENALTNDFAFICPVSPRGAARVVNRRLRDDLGIPSDAKVIAAIGSVAAWTMFPEIAYSVGDWPAGYVLLIHERYGAARARLKELGLDNLELTGRVYVSTYAANHPDEMAYVLAGSTAGLAFYRQQPGHPLLNKNLELLGRSSGKIATLARHGIPIITNAPGFAANDVREFEAGIACESPQDLSRIFMEQDVETFAPGAVRYFEDVLSFDNYQEDFRKRLEILHDSLPTK